MRVELLDGWVELERRRVCRGEQQLRLSEKESALLGFLAEHPNEALSRRELLVEVWGYHPDVRSRTLDTTVRRLRAKIEPEPRRPQLVQTVTGVGYRFVPPERPDPRAPVRLRAPTAPRARVPIDPRPLVGRDTDLASLLRYLEHHRAVCVGGPGGVGKSRLLRAAAHAWAIHTGGAAWWVSVDGVEHADALADRVARTMSMRLPRQDGLAFLGERLAQMGPLLLVLDGADDLDEASLGCVAGWAGARERLWVALSCRSRPEGPWQAMRLRPLAPADAEELFRMALRERLPQLELPADRVAALVSSLDGLPLSLSLAAARIRVLGVDGLIARLSQGDDVLRDPVDDSEHGALQRVLRRSWELLSPSLRGAACLAAIPQGPFALDLAEPLCDGIDVIEALVDAGWVEARPGDTPTFEVLACVRRFLEQQPRPGGVRRLAEVLEAQAAGLLDPLFGASTLEACVWLRQRADDLEACIASGHRTPGLIWASAEARLQIGDDRGALERWASLGPELVPCLRTALSDLPSLDERRASLARAEAALGGVEASPERARARAALALARGRLLRHTGALEEAAAELEASFSSFEALRDPVGLAVAARHLCLAHSVLGNYEAIERVRARGLAQIGEDSLAGLDLILAGYHSPQHALEKMRAGLPLTRAAGDRRRLAHLLVTIAIRALSEGALEEAAARAGEAAEAVLGAQGPSLRASVLGNTAIVLRELARFETASLLFARAVAEIEGRDLGGMGVDLLLNVSMLELDRGQLQAARDALEQVRARAQGDPLSLARLALWGGVADRLAGSSGVPAWRASLRTFLDHDQQLQAAAAQVLLATLDPPDAEALLIAARDTAQRFGDVSVELAAEIVWSARGGTPWSTPSGERPPPERWLSLVRIVRRLIDPPVVTPRHMGA